jgi:hypothetical protein
MATIRTHRYTVDPPEVAEFVARRGRLIAAVRAACPGLAQTRLTRLDDATFTDTWRWDTAEQMQAAAVVARTLPEAGAAMSLVRDHSAEDGDVIDER